MQLCSKYIVNKFCAIRTVHKGSSMISSDEELFLETPQIDSQIPTVQSRVIVRQCFQRCTLTESPLHNIKELKLSTETVIWPT